MKLLSTFLGAAVVLASFSSAAHDTSPPNPQPPGPACAASWGGWYSCVQNTPTACQSSDWSVNLTLTGPQHTGCHLYVVSDGAFYHLRLGEVAANSHSQCDWVGLSPNVMAPNAVRYFDCQANGVATQVDANYRGSFGDCQ